MWVVVHIYGIGRVVYEVLDEFCWHFVASEHFDRRMHGRLNNVLIGGKSSRERSLYFIMHREGNDVCTIEWYLLPPNK